MTLRSALFLPQRCYIVCYLDGKGYLCSVKKQKFHSKRFKVMKDFLPYISALILTLIATMMVGG